MGRQQGLVHLTGQYGDVQLSINADGKPISKFAPKKSGKKVKQNAEYIVTRKNNDEFTGAAYTAKSLRSCMGEKVKQFSDRHLGNRFMALTRWVIGRGAGPGGQRTFEVMLNSDIFKGIELNKREGLSARFHSRFNVGVNTDRNTATLDVPPFVPQHYIHPPSGARFYRLVFVVGVLSDAAYTGDAMVYGSLHPDLDGLSTTVSSALLPIDNSPTAALQMVAAIQGLPILPATAGLIVSVGIVNL